MGELIWAWLVTIQTWFDNWKPLVSLVGAVVSFVILGTTTKSALAIRGLQREVKKLREENEELIDLTRSVEDEARHQEVLQEIEAAVTELPKGVFKVEPEIDEDAVRADLGIRRTEQLLGVLDCTSFRNRTDMKLAITHDGLHLRGERVISWRDFTVIELRSKDEDTILFGKVEARAKGRAKEYVKILQTLQSEVRRRITFGEPASS